MDFILLNLLHAILNHNDQDVHYISAKEGNFDKKGTKDIFLIEQKEDINTFSCLGAEIDLEYGFFLIAPFCEEAIESCLYNGYGVSKKPSSLLDSGLSMAICQVTLLLSESTPFLEYNNHLYSLLLYCATQHISLICRKPFSHKRYLFNGYYVENLVRSNYNQRNKDLHIKYYISEEDTERIEGLKKLVYFNNKTNSFSFFTQGIYNKESKKFNYLRDWYTELRKISSDAIFGRLDLYKTAGNSTSTTMQSGQIYDFWFNSLFLVEGVCVGMAHWRENYLYFALVCKNRNIYQIQFDILKMYENIDWYNEYTDVQEFVLKYMTYSGLEHSYYNKYYIGFYDRQDISVYNLLERVEESLIKKTKDVNYTFGNFGSYADLCDKLHDFFMYKYYIDHLWLKKSDAGEQPKAIYRTEWIATPTLLYRFNQN